MATKLEGEKGGKALGAGPLKKLLFLRLPLALFTWGDISQILLTNTTSFQNILHSNLTGASEIQQLVHLK